MSRLRSALVCLVLAAAVVTATWVGDPTQTRTGRALACCHTKFTLGMTGVRKGDDMYWLSPSSINQSDHEIVLIAVTPDVTTPGLEFVDARVYRRSDFLVGVPLGWGGKYNSYKTGSPAQVKSVPVGGQKLVAGETMEDVMLLRFRVTTDQLPLSPSGVKVLYEQKSLRRFQVLPARFELDK